RPDVGRELLVVADDRPASAQRAREVARLGPVQRVKVPGCPAAMGHVRAEPGAHHLLFVPEVLYPRVGHAVAVPAVAAIAEQHVEPDRVDPHVRGWVLWRNSWCTHLAPWRHSGQVGETSRISRGLPASRSNCACSSAMLRRSRSAPVPAAAKVSPEKAGGDFCGLSGAGHGGHPRTDWGDASELSEEVSRWARGAARGASGTPARTPACACWAGTCG